MQRQYVSSTDLLSVGYDPAEATLEIEFRSGGIYQYFAVPESVYQALMSAPSHGKYFHAHIKPSFRYLRVR